MLTIGTFDGLHLGHRKILSRLMQQGMETVVLTFFPHPRMVLYPEDHGIQLLNTIPEKIKLFEETGIGHLIIEPFTLDFARMSAEKYMQDIIVNGIGADRIIIGYDHRFGRNRAGDLRSLEIFAAAHQLDLEEISREDIDEVAISSTKIRIDILEGNVSRASRLLGRNYTLEGTVVQGDQMGRTLGFPTANIGDLPNYKLIPKDGVYAVQVYVENLGDFKGVMNIGVRPTMQGKERRLEVHIPHFEGDLYGKNLRVAFVSRIRDEQKFPNIEALKSQLVLDRDLALDLLQ